jgi:hypothetical protein
MAHFDTAFRLWADAQSGTLLTVAETAEIQPGVLYRLRTGKKSPTSDIIEKLLPAVEKHDCRQAADKLLIAWLSDLMPPEYGPDITISIRGEAPVPDLLQTAIDHLRRRAERDPQYADSIITQFLTTRHSDLQTVADLLAQWHASNPLPRYRKVIDYRDHLRSHEEAKVAESPFHPPRRQPYSAKIATACRKKLPRGVRDSTKSNVKCLHGGRRNSPPTES